MKPKCVINYCLFLHLMQPLNKKLLKLRVVKLRCAEYDKSGRPPAPLAAGRGLPAQYAAAA